MSVRRRRSRTLAALAVVTLAAATSVTTIAAGTTAPRDATRSLSVGFGSVHVGQASSLHTAVVPLASTLGAKRALIEGYLNSGAVVFSDITVNSIVVLSAAQVKAAVLATLDGLPDNTPIAFKVLAASLIHGTDFTLSGDCVGTDGATTSTCTVGSTFVPIEGGPRSDGVDVSVTLTQGFDAFVNELGTVLTNSYGLSGFILSAALSVVSPFIHAQLDAAISGSISPVASLSGVGVSVLTIASGLSTAEGNAGSHLLLVPVTLNAASSSDVHFSFATFDGTASILGHDYKPIAGTATIKAGATTLSIPVTVFGDTTVESNEYFILKISAPTGATLGTSVNGRINVLNDDLPPVTVVGSSVPEGAPAYFSVALAKPFNVDVTLHVRLQSATATPADFGPLSSTTVLIPAESTAPVFVVVPTKLDGAVEPDQSFVLIVTGAQAPVGVSSIIKANVT